MLAFPLLGLVAWNFAVYALLVVFAFRPAHTRPAPVRAWIASLGQRMAARLIARSRAFSAAAADALDAFAREWYESARPLLLARATRAFHLAAAAVGVGLVAGLYVRGIAFDYEAGWESTFLDAPRARAILAIVYGPPPGSPASRSRTWHASRLPAGARGREASPRRSGSISWRRPPLFMWWCRASCLLSRLLPP